MTLTDHISFFSIIDGAGLVLLFVAWIGIGWVIEHPGRHPSVSVLMASYRREWMRQMVTRNPRIFDSQTLSLMRQGTSFFASGTMIAIGGCLALIGNSDQLAGVASDLTFDTAPSVVWEIKIIVTILFLTNAFLKFVWSHRLFGYCAVLMAAVPNDASDPAAMPRAAKAAEINITASRGFNRGLRSIYFALGTLAWLLGPVPLILATVATVAVLWRREFASQSRAVLCGAEDGMGHTQT